MSLNEKNKNTKSENIFWKRIKIRKEVNRFFKRVKIWEGIKNSCEERLVTWKEFIEKSISVIKEIDEEMIKEYAPALFSDNPDYVKYTKDQIQKEKDSNPDYREALQEIEKWEEYIDKDKKLLNEANDNLIYLKRELERLLEVKKSLSNKK